MISKKLAIKVINTALSTGADFAEIYYEVRHTKNISTENEIVDLYTNTTIEGCGLRIIKGTQSVFGSSEDVNVKSLLALATQLASRFNDEQKITVESFKTKKAKNINTLKIPYESVDDAEIIEMLKTASKAVKKLSPYLVRRTYRFFVQSQEKYIFNSESKLFINKEQRARFMGLLVANKDGKIETNFVGKGTKAGFEYFKETLNVVDVALENAKICLKMVDAVECPSGKMPVVLGNGWGGVLFHESCGHPLEATSVAKHMSCFDGKLNTAIASPIVNAVDDGTIPNAWGSINMDDEGHKAHKNQLIKNGICTGYLIDQFNGKKMNMHETGNSRRESYGYEPTSRMTNTYIENGKSTKEEIIKATKLGLYAVSFGGGQVDPSTGEFNFGCSEAYIIRDGKICEPVRGAMLIGKGNEILHNIDMIANDLDLADGMCGSASGSIPVTVGQPTLRIKEITVGGNGGELK